MFTGILTGYLGTYVHDSLRNNSLLNEDIETLPHISLGLCSIQLIEALIGIKSLQVLIWPLPHFTHEFIFVHTLIRLFTHPSTKVLVRYS